MRKPEDILFDAIPLTHFESFMLSPMAEDLTVAEELWLRKHPQHSAEGYSRALHWLRNNPNQA